MALILEQASASQLNLLPRERSVFFFSLGLIEDHGPHLPLGLDLLEAERLAQMAAERLENTMPGWHAVMMPRIPLGIDSNTQTLAITVRGYVLRDWLVDTCASLYRLGFKHFVCFSGHVGPKQLTAIEEASQLLKIRAGGTWIRRVFRGRRDFPKLVSASSALVGTEDLKASFLWPDPQEHGGARDTSMALALIPDGVDPSYKTLPLQLRQKSRWARALKRWKREVSGYWGNPSEAKSETGAAELSRQTDEVFLKLKAVWEGSNPEGLFRTWFSIIPIHRTFFKAWFLTLMLFSLLLVWVYVSFWVMIGT